MSLKDRISKDAITAMKEKDQTKLSTLRMLKAEIKNEEINKTRELDDEGVLDVIQKEIKKRKEAIEGYKKGNRQDLVDKEEAEMNLLYTYLPRQADDDEIKTILKQILAEIPAGTTINMGMIMPQALKQLKGKADGKRISAIAQQLINS